MFTPIASGWTDNDRERWDTPAERFDANDDAQISARRVVASLAVVRRELTAITDGAADYSIKTIAEDLLEDLDNIEQSAGIVLAAAINASGRVVNERPATAVAVE